MSALKVVFFHRKPYPGVSFSIENLFSCVRNALPVEISWQVRELKFFSRGFFKRLFIGVEAALNQGDVNHITGDVHFVALFLKKKRTVLTIHDVGFMNHPNVIARWVLKLFWLSLPVRNVSVVTTVSEATKKAVLSHVSVDPDRIQVVYDPILPVFRKNLKPFNKVQPTVLQIGTKPNKNIPRLIEAIRGLNLKLDIIGRMTEELVKLIEDAGIPYSHSVNLSNEQMYEKYVSADIVSFVSTNEGFGMPIIEANAVGRVVVTSNTSSMPEIAGDAAHLVNPFDVESIRRGFEKIVQDDEYRELLIANGFRNSRRFNVHEIAHEYALIYKRMTP